MQTPFRSLMSRQTRSQWVRLRTLVLVRWMAIIGQFIAITVASQGYGMQIDLLLCYAAVAASVLSNLLATFFVPQAKRLSEREAMLTLLFDISQLSFLLYLTGGLTNPFALLMLAPVTISATALQLRTTLFLGATAAALITLLAFHAQPLRFETGEALIVPPLFGFGFWLAILTGIVFLGLYARRVASEIHAMGDALLATQMALAREQKLTDLGGVVAAAAHELGTPLATIKLVSSELADELRDHPELREDVELIRSQADRCRDILRSMGRSGKDDLHLHRAPLEAVLSEAADPHAGRGKAVVFELQPGRGGAPEQPTIFRQPEIIHGLRNLIQNAVDFAKSTVWVEASWSAQDVRVRIVDDGPGYPLHLLGRIGEPFLRERSEPQEQVLRPEYEGMGLGLFIAKTLLERTGAEISFANARSRDCRDRGTQCGALVEVVWPRDRLCAESRPQLGQNQPLSD